MVKARVYDRSLAGTVGSNHAADMVVRLLLSIVVRYLRRADQSSRGVLQNVACLSVDREASIMRRPLVH